MPQSLDGFMLDARWGCKLSQKMFVGREYVLKHVRNKHTSVMEAKQEEVPLSPHCSCISPDLCCGLFPHEWYPHASKAHCQLS